MKGSSSEGSRSNRSGAAFSIGLLSSCPSGDKSPRPASHFSSARNRRCSIMSVFGLRDGFPACLGVLLLCTLCRENWSATPANDNFADRQQLEGESFEIRGSVSGGTLEQGELSKTTNSLPTWYIGDSTVWYSWKAPANSLVLVKPKTRTSGGMITIAAGA